MNADETSIVITLGVILGITVVILIALLATRNRTMPVLSSENDLEMTNFDTFLENVENSAKHYEVLDCFPTINYVNDKGVELVCAVCLWRVQTGDTIKRLSCNHSFHESCLASMICQSRAYGRCKCRCPLCRAPLFENTFKTWRKSDPTRLPHGTNQNDPRIQFV